jgi:RNA polymerase sigma-70 factor (ECF subfamily)
MNQPESSSVGSTKEQINQELLRRCQQGDHAAFDLLFTRYQGQVYRLARAMLRNVEDAEDVVQDVFAGLIRSIRTYDPERGQFDSWLNQIVVNQCRRKLQRKRLVSIPLSLLGHHNDYDDELEFEPPDLTPQSLPENVALSNDTLRTLAHEVNHLSEKLRLVVILRYYMDMSCAEIAATLGCSEGTVHSRLFTARQRLQKALSNDNLGDSQIMSQLLLFIFACLLGGLENLLKKASLR